MCVKYESCRAYPFYMMTLQRLPIFHYFVCYSLGSFSTSFPVDLSYVLSHKSHNTYRIYFKVFVFEREQNIQNDIKLSLVDNNFFG